ncbi:MAG: hypothetical protein M5R42_20735 [Rhodocyclaceae bacterium]|nr:hypothetical protein [Rhodocyclaceae bacterium]
MNRTPCMFILTLAAASALSGFAYAADGAKGRESQPALKARLIEHIDAKIRILQTAKACVSAAADMKAMAVCHEQERKQTKDLKKQSRTDIQERKVQRPERKGPAPAPAAK